MREEKINKAKRNLNAQSIFESVSKKQNAQGI